MPVICFYLIFLILFYIFGAISKLIMDNNYSAILCKIEKVPRGIQGEKSSKDMGSSRNLVSTIGAQASPKKGDGTRCPEG